MSQTCCPGRKGHLTSRVVTTQYSMKIIINITVTMSQIFREIQYGERSCFENTTAAQTEEAANCSSLEEEAECVGRPGCYWHYNGLGIDYQVNQHPVFNVVPLATIEDIEVLLFTWSPRPAPHIVSSPAGVHHTKHCAGLQLETGKMSTKESIMNLRRQSVMAPHLAPLYVVSVGYPRCVRPPDQTVVASPLHLPCHLANLSGRQGWGGQSLT